MNAFRALVVTVSDRCSRGEAEDKSGPRAAELVKAFLLEHHYSPEVKVVVVPDDIMKIQTIVADAADIITRQYALIITTGGTGFGPRDVTPEAVRPLLDKEAPGLSQFMLLESMKQTPCAWLSRAVAGVRKKSLIVTLPGSPKAVEECLAPLFKSGLMHAIKLCSGVADAHPVEPRSGSSVQVVDVVDEPKNTDIIVLRGPAASRPRVSAYPMVSMEAAFAMISDHVPKPVVISLSPIQAVRHVLADDVRSAFGHPPFRASIKDGYAVIAADGVGEYPLVGSLVAGAHPSSFSLSRGQICRVNTGGPVPPGADAVVQVEDTSIVESTAAGEETIVKISKAVTPGYDVRPIGCDLMSGGVALQKGQVIHAPEVGLAMSVGADAVSVFRKPVVAVLSTGDELVDGKSTATKGPPPPGKIFDSNRSMLIAALIELGFECVDCGIAEDNLPHTRKKLSEAVAKADVIISSGGVSMGEADCLKTVLLDLGATIHFGRVNMKPGKPTTFATIADQKKVFFALPGNPVSAMVCFHLFVVTAIKRMAGMNAQLTTFSARLQHAVKMDPERPEYHRCRVEREQVVVAADHAVSGVDATKTTTKRDGFVVSSTGIQASHRLLSMSGANGMMIIPAGAGQLPEGSIVETVLIDSVGL